MTQEIHNLYSLLQYFETWILASGPQNERGPFLVGAKMSWRFQKSESIFFEGNLVF